MRAGRLHLSDRARLLVFCGSSGDPGYSQRVIVGEGSGIGVRARKTPVEDGWQPEYVTYCLTP